MLPRKFSKFALTSDTRAYNCGRQFSDGIKKKTRGKERVLAVCGTKSGSRGPPSLPGPLTSLSFHLSRPRTASRGDITTLPRSSRSIPHPLTIFIPSHTAFPRSSPGAPIFFLPRCPGPFLPPILSSCQNSFTSPALLSWSRVGNVRGKLILLPGKKKICLSRQARFYCLQRHGVRRLLCVNLNLNRIISNFNRLRQNASANFVDSRNRRVGLRMPLRLPGEKLPENRFYTDDDSDDACCRLFILRLRLCCLNTRRRFTGR